MTNEYKIIILGSGGVGKTSLTVQLTQNVFDEEYNPTIEDTYRKEMVIDGKTVVLNILDTAGQEGYEVLRNQHLKDGHGFILVYDITKYESFQEINNFFDSICRAKDVDNFPIVLVGNKSDLEDQRMVARNDGDTLAGDNYWQFFEASAKEKHNVDESFSAIIRDVIDYQEQSSDQGTPSSGGQGKRFGRLRKLFAGKNKSKQ